jgi:hypothetical protein
VSDFNASSTLPGQGAERGAAGGPEGRLDNNAKSSRNRSEKWAARGVQWMVSALPRCRKCGRVTVTNDGRVGVRANGQAVGFAGLSTCGSVWSCPVCNSRIQSVRRLEVGVALASVAAMGGGAAFGAITVRHHAGQRLGPLLDGLTYGIARIARDKSVAALRERMGYLGRIQALEITVGLNGWHPHRHPLPVFARPVSEGALVDLHFAEFRAFRRGVEHRGFEAPSMLANVLMPVDLSTGDTLGEYFAKSEYSAAGVAFEAASSSTKKGRRGSRTPWQLLDGVRTTGDADDLDLWNEYEKSTRGKRALTFSRGLRDRLGLGLEASDEQIADAEVGDAYDTGFYVTDWTPVARNSALGAGLLNAVTPAGHWQDGRDFCRANGIPIEENDQ